jgi:predicted secreted hydrolase
VRTDSRSPAPRLLGVLLATAIVLTCQREGTSVSVPPTTTLVLTNLLARGDTEGYQRATEPRTFSFPDDHGAHPDFRNEWWYLTGNLTSADGHQFGYQFTLFRSAITPDDPDRQSDWATRQLYMAHFAVTDVQANTFHASERLSRGAVGLAGVTTEPFRAWLDDWEIAGDNPPPFRLRAGTDGGGLEV